MVGPGIESKVGPRFGDLGLDLGLHSVLDLGLDQRLDVG